MLSSPPPHPPVLSVSEPQQDAAPGTGGIGAAPPLPRVLSVVRAKAADWRDSFIGKCKETPFIGQGAWTG